MATEQNQTGERGKYSQTNIQQVHLSGEDIIQDARNEDQLDQLHEALPPKQNDKEEKEEDLGGTTNLSLDQLQAARENNADNINDQDDLN